MAIRPMPGDRDAITQTSILCLQHHLKPIDILLVATLGDEIGPQNWRTLSHPFAHNWIDS